MSATQLHESIASSSLPWPNEICAQVFSRAAYADTLLGTGLHRRQGQRHMGICRTHRLFNLVLAPLITLGQYETSSID